ncbi:MAG: nucleotidyltransferase domain-containing protein [Candidatus Undinarchaeales archaeon]|jgi:predicted nucleotidyltransferase|nr:nucleotidyltransferase domain-containing protein [Candidatus Undinarchaeales archaeon]
MRELSRLVGLTHPALLNHLRALVTDSLLVRSEEGLYPTYEGNMSSEMFRLLKGDDTVHRLDATGIVDYIEESLRPDCIVLFGSAAHGEDTEESDIDLFVQARERELDLGAYEGPLCRRVHVLFEPEVRQLAPELLNNIANGRVLRGYLKVA